jgi:hypothetical protein
MKHLLPLSLLMLLYTTPAASQKDTTYLFFNQSWQECNKDTALYYGIVYKKDDMWARKDFWVKGNILQMDATYIDQACKTGHGTFKWYRENGTLKNTVVYDHGKSKTADYFYESGKKKGHIIYTGNGSLQQGWDENGQEIPDYVVEREAVFPGGLHGWKAYLEENLNADVAAKSKAKPGIYTVKVQFVVDKEGNISNVNAIEVPEACSRCGKEAVKIIRNGPKWEPAVQDNKRVLYQALQYISFQVVEE